MSKNFISHLVGEVTNNSAHALIAELKSFKEAGAKSIRLLIDSAGGEVPAGFMLRKVIAELNIPVHAEVTGQCSSIAIVVLQACSTRKAVSQACFNLHFMSSPMSTLMDYAEELGCTEARDNAQKRRKLMQEEIILYTRLRSNLSRAEVLQIMLGNQAFRANKAFALGLLDDVMVGHYKKAAT